MKQIIAKFNKSLAAGIIFIAVCIFGIASYMSGLFNPIEYWLYDIRVRIFANNSRPSDDIVVVLLDQNSIDWAQQERGWGWPWPRDAYGELIDYLRIGEAKSLAIDVIFSEPSIYGNVRNDDEIFAQAAEDFGRTVQIVVFSSQTGNQSSWPVEINKPLFNLHNFENIQSEYEKLNQNVEQTGQIRALFPIPELQNAAGVIGNVTGWADSDGIFRRSNLFSIFDGQAVPSISAASLIVSGEQNTDIFYNETKKQIEWENLIIPVDKNGRSLLNFRGNLNRYHPYWAGDVLQSAEDFRNGREPLLNPEDFKDKYVFFGYYAQGLFDIFSSPIESVYPGVGIHITMLDNLLQQDFIKESPLWLDLFIIIIPVGLVVFIVLNAKKIRLSVAGTILIFAILLGFCVVSYSLSNTWVYMTVPLISIALAFLGSTLYSYATEGSQKRFIKDAFSRYLAPSVIEHIIADPSKLNLGGEKREMTAIFTDIQSFSSISEALQNEYAGEGPKVLVNLLNLYLTEMSNIILENGGTVDKYEGDAIIAFFGAPIWTDTHAALACKSAIQMKKREEELSEVVMDPQKQYRIPLEKLIESGRLRPDRPLFTRLGINSGDMVVGNMGTPNKMNYTIMGNAVNLSARLEGVNKQYDTGGILISEYTKEKIGDEFIVRPLSRVRVVGINNPLRLYELLDLRQSASPEMIEMTKAWENAFKSYEDRKFHEAKSSFALIFEKNEKDFTARRYVKKCQSYLDGEKLPADFPIDNLTEK